MNVDKEARETVAKRMAIGGLILAVVFPIFLPEATARAVCFSVGVTLFFMSFYIGTTSTRGGGE